MADRDEGTRFEANPIERVRDLIEANRNYFPELEQAAEKPARRIERAVRATVLAALSTRFARKSIRSSPASCRSMSCARRCGGSIAHRRQLLISETGRWPRPRLPARLPDGALPNAAPVLRPSRVARGPLDDTPRRLYRITLANYFAGRRDDALSGVSRCGGKETLSYDVHVLARRFQCRFSSRSAIA